MRSACALVIALAALACGDSTSSPPAVSGSYTLILSDGQSLPDTIGVGGGSTVLISGRLEFFRSDSVRDIKTTQGLAFFGPGQVLTDTLLLGYTSASSGILIRYPSPSQFRARTDTVTMSEGGSLTVRTKLFATQVVRILTYARS